MKILFLFLALFFVGSLAFAEDEPVGRYQLISGVYEMVSKGVAIQSHVIMRIDTKTGRTWEYAEVIGKDGKMTVFWSPIPDKTLTGE